MSPDWSAKVQPVPYAKLDDPQSLNLYAYVTNNPATGVDLDGHQQQISMTLDAELGMDGGDDDDDTPQTPASVASAAFARGVDPAQGIQSWIAHAFAQLWANYPTHAKYDSDPGAANSIWSHIGGGVDAFGKWLVDHGQEANTCALRMSEALNQSGLSITKQKGTFKGANGKYYYLSVSGLEGFLTRTLGDPHILKGGTFAGPTGSSGIVAFNVSAWRPGATGHLSLWNGSGLIDRSEEGYDRWIRTGALPQSTFFWGVQ